MPGDILGNLKVRISDPWKNNLPNFFLEILYWFETSKNDHSREGTGEAAGALIHESMCLFYFPKMLFYSQNCPFISRHAHLFSGIDLLFSRSVFLFLKNTLLFSRIALYFSRSFFFLFIVCTFSKNAFFPADCTFSLSCS